MNLWTPDDSARAIEIGGLLPRTTELGGWRFRRRGSDQDEQVPVWDGERDNCPILPDDQIVPQDSLEPYEWDDVDQNGYPACTLAAHANAIEFFMAKTGRAKTKVDWLKAWRILSGGRGGVEIGRALDYAMSTGLPLLDGSGVVVVTEAWDAPSVKAFQSGLEKGGIGLFGHDAHCECGAYVASKTMLGVRNSWGPSGRWHLFPFSEMEISSYGAVIIREIELRPIDVTDLPDVAA